MSKAYAGVKEIGHSDDKAATIAAIGDSVTVTKLVGRIRDDSTNGKDKITTGATDGLVSGGSQVSPEWHVLSRSSFAALEALEAADTEKYWYLFYFDGRVQVSDVPFNIMVADSDAFNMEDGADAITITTNKKGITPNIFRNLPAS